MSLYTKYRPQSFEDVVGQDSAITYFQNIINKNNKGEIIPHAYLLSGGHGIGKTTIARIFARELGVDHNDIYELDAASTSRKIDDMREIIDSAYTMPTLSKYKVYIFDEAHMLTKESSNAFLKILEEPPMHVIFILCTTDPEKLISTIRSRCNIINLERPSIEKLENRLDYILKSEKIILNKDKKEEKDIINLIAKNSNKSYRDSITNLEKVLHTFQSDIQESNLKSENLENIFGKNQIEIYLEIFDILNSIKNNLKNKEEQKIVSKLDSLEKEYTELEELLDFINKNYRYFSYNKFLEYFRNAMFIRSKVQTEEEFDNLEFKDFVIKNQAFFISKNLLYFLEKSELYENIRDKKSVLTAVFGNFVEEK